MQETSPAAIAKIVLIGAQLGLLILIIRLFEVQTAAFLDVSLLVLFGFLIHSFLPLRLRPGFFLFLSLTSIVLVLGVKSGAWVIGLGLVLIGICYLPIRFSARVALLIAAGAFLASLRMDWISAPWETGVWPILSAMFMFRLIIYLYDIKHEKGRPELTRTLSYFFMLPNVCFPLFPVVDYKKFNRNYYNEAPERIYQRCISWIFRGVLHLLVYRVVYQHLTVDPVTVNGLAAMLQFSFAAFLLYLQVSGSFHMIVGMLLLFGFNLPETNHLYFLASSFNDFWRRINIYWKDFMMKVFYYPVYFRVKKLGETRAIVISTLIVFFATWFLHAFQWFWLRGTFLVELNDALYWAILSFLVIGNSLYEIKYGRDRSLGGHSRSRLDYMALVPGTLGTFLTMGLLWGMWSSDSMSQWVSMWGTTGAGWIVMLVLIPGLFVLARFFGQLARARRTGNVTPARRPAPEPQGFWKKGLAYTASMCLIFIVGHGAAYSYLPSSAAAAVEMFRTVQLNARDRAQLERGYYENLIGVNRHSAEMWGMLAEKPDDWGWTDEKTWNEYVFSTHDLRHKKMAPNVEFMFKLNKVSSNRWGMRDQDYELKKPANTIRIALLGASHAWGSGVGNDETFEAVLEQRLNEHSGGPHYQVLNFAQPGRDALNQVPVLEMDVLPFEPDAIVLIEHHGAARRLIRNFAKNITDGIEIPYDYLGSLVEHAGVDRDMPLDMVRNRLAPFSDEVLEWSYKRLVATSREAGARPLWVYLPLTNHRLVEEDIAAEVSRAKEAGFTTISLVDVYSKYDEKTLSLAKWDRHPNAFAHRLIAERLYDIFSARHNEILGVTPEPVVRAVN
ncbi:MAG: SGNH/GDSL hydrolase family protein [Gammaproteobacteria bacterium]